MFYPDLSSCIAVRHYSEKVAVPTVLYPWPSFLFSDFKINIFKNSVLKHLLKYKEETLSHITQHSVRLYTAVGTGNGISLE